MGKPGVPQAFLGPDTSTLVSWSMHNNILIQCLDPDKSPIITHVQCINPVADFAHSPAYRRLYAQPCIQ